MAEDSDLFHRLKRHGLRENVATKVVSSKKFTSSDLEDWAIESLATLKPHDAINIIKNISFKQNTANKSKLLCSHINTFKKTCKEETSGEKDKGHGGKSQDRGQQTKDKKQGGHKNDGTSGRNRGGNSNLEKSTAPGTYESVNNPCGYGNMMPGFGYGNRPPGNGLLPTPLAPSAPPAPPAQPPPLMFGMPPPRPLLQLPIQPGPVYSGDRSHHQTSANTDARYLDRNLDRLKELSASASGLPDIDKNQDQGDMHGNGDKAKKKRNRNRNRRKGSAREDKQGQQSDDGDSESESGSNFGSSRDLSSQSDRGFNHRYSSTGNLAARGGRNSGNQGSRGGRGKGNHGNSKEVLVDINIDDDRRSESGQRGQGRGRGQRGGRGRSSRGRQKRTNSGTSQDKDDAVDSAENSEAESVDEDAIDENELFTYLVKSCDGFICMEELSQQCDLIPDNVDICKWFLDHRRRFKLFIRNGKILYVSAYYKDATLCLSYNGLFGRSKICKKTDCEHFHICKDYISGSCSYGENCSYSHSFRDPCNVEHKKKLQLNMFSDRDMIIILKNRYPTICSEFLKTTTCSGGNDCPSLHLCSLSLKQKCFRGKECPRGHSYDTEHNKWVLQAYDLTSWISGKGRLLLNKSILVDKSVEAELDAGGADDSQAQDAEVVDDLIDLSDEIEQNKEVVPPRPISRKDRFKPKPDDVEDLLLLDLSQMHVSDMTLDPLLSEESSDTAATTEAGGAKPKTKQKRSQSGKANGSSSNPTDNSVSVEITWLDDSASGKAICSKFIEGKCQAVCPKGQHHLSLAVPYLWQIKHSNDWHCFSKEYNEEIENGFCQCGEVIDAEIVVDDTATYMVHVCVGNAKKMEGVVYECDGVMLQSPERLPIRRLSTESYIVNKDKKSAASPGFLTQWRFFWRDDNLVWQPFENDKLQRTLESKYKYEQPTYLFSRENYRFKYRIDFRTFRQVNLETGKNRDLCRRPLFVPMENVRKKQYPTTLDTSDPLPKPPTFSPWDLSSEFELVELERVKKEFKDVRDSFYATLDSTKFDILYIYRVQNWKLYQDYNQMKKKMQKDIEVPSQEVNEKFLFHGTDTIDICRGICINNFDFRTSGKNATMYGQGSYFATTAKYSHNYTRAGANNQRFMFRAKVLVGMYTMGNSSYRRPPERPGQTHKLYDSCVNDEVNPSMYIIFERSQSYPEYLIAYKESVKYDISGASSVDDGMSAVTSPERPASVVSPVSIPSPNIQHVSSRPVVSHPTSRLETQTPETPIVYPRHVPFESPITYPHPVTAREVPIRPANQGMDYNEYRRDDQAFIERRASAERFAASVRSQPPTYTTKKKDEGCVLQ